MPLPPPETMDLNDRGRYGGYGRHDTHRLNAGRLSHPLPETIELLVDERSADITPLFADIPHLDVVLTRLPFGDLCAVHGDRALVFALTTGREICAALDDGRLTTLVRGLGRISHPACMIVEGGLYLERSQPLSRLSALHARLSFGVGIPIVETIDRRHTCYMVVSCARDRFFPDGARARFVVEARRLPAVDDTEIARAMLETIPGVSRTRSASLLDRFGSLSTLSRASLREIAATDGVGRITAARILSVLSASAGAS